MLRDGAGFDLLTELRGAGLRTPVIILSSRDDEADRVAGLEGGADDYVVKPFSPREVVARIRAVLRRVPRRLGSEPNLPAAPPAARESTAPEVAPRDSAAASGKGHGLSVDNETRRA